LLPEENFESSEPPYTLHIQILSKTSSSAQGVLTASSDGSISSEASGCGILSPNKKGVSSRVPHGCYVTTITRGWSAEADKLLDYLVRLFDYSGIVLSLTYLVPKENGIFDAIKKQYLRSFIFAIYLVRARKTLCSHQSLT
jgi:hypothetical protein